MDGVYYLGHSSALAIVGGKSILFDPVWNHKPYGEYWKFVPEQTQIQDATLDQVHHCVVSHIHEDHICEEILRKLKCKVTVKHGRHNLDERIKKVAQLETLPPYQWFPLSEGVEIYFVGHAFNSIDSSCFVRSKNFCVYHGSDNFLNLELLKRIKADVPSLDVAMVPYAFVHWYPQLLDSLSDDEKRSENQRLNAQSLNQAAMFIKEMNPRFVIPFGNSLYYDGGTKHPLNAMLADPTDLGDLFECVLPMFAGDSVHENGDIYIKPRSMPLMMKHYLGDGQERPIDPSNAKEEDLIIVRERLNFATRVENHSIVVNNIIIDLDKLTMGLVNGSEPVERHYTKFAVDTTEFFRWLRGLISFEQVIGTRRFRCERSPNVYNLKVFEWFNNYL